MKRTQRILALLVAVLTGHTPLAVAGEAKELPVQLVVSLTDGSLLAGTTTLTRLPLRSEALGKIKIPLAKIRTVKFSRDHESLTVALANGDILQGGIGAATLALQTLFGEVQVPLEMTVEIRVVSILAGAAIKDGLVAYFPFDGDAGDRSGNGNTGKVVGASFQSDEDTGQKVLQVKGAGSSYVVVPRAASLEPMDGITISMWVKGVPGQAAGHGWGMVLRKADDCQPGYHIRGGGVSSFHLEGTTPCAAASYKESVSFLEFNATKWQHIVATYSRSAGSMETYQDGERINQKSLAVPLVHSGDLYIGGSVVSGDDGGFRGRIAEVRIYNRGLDAAEIRALYSRGLNVR